MAIPPSGNQDTSDAIKNEALDLFFSGKSYTCKPTTGGVNNIVQYVELEDGDRYILRVYNNGNNSDKVRFEHEVLRQLREQTLSFKVPEALLSKNGKTHELLSNGAECCVFHIIPGTLAKTTSPEEVGRATGELSAAMAKVKIDFPSPIAPYFELFKVHHAIRNDSNIFYNEVATNKQFDICRADIDYLCEELKNIESRIANFHKLNLPKQLIHGDLHYDNVMVVDDKVSGLLDFEFCAYDWRAMELAVSLSKYVGESDPLKLCKEFIAGFGEHGRLTETEIQSIPDLIILRIVSNVVYFTGRAIAKEDTLDALTTRAGTYAKRVRWLNVNRDAIVSAIREKVSSA
eukprot:Colp12_sorted_trinity150504_noHs@22136